MNITAAVHNGMSPWTALRIWGEVLARDKRIIPDGWGWPGASIEARLMRYGAGAGEPGRRPFLTGPEAAGDRLNADRAIASWVASILSGIEDQKVRVFAHLYWVNNKCWVDIAAQLSEDETTTPKEVERMRNAVIERVRRAMKKIPIQMEAA